jgi:hypothetical protein
MKKRCPTPRFGNANFARARYLPRLARVFSFHLPLNAWRDARYPRLQRNREEVRVDSEEGQKQASEIQRLLNRVRDIQQTQDRLMRELDESIEATDHVLRDANSRGSGSTK